MKDFRKKNKVLSCDHAFNCAELLNCAEILSCAAVLNCAEILSCAEVLNCAEVWACADVLSYADPCHHNSIQKPQIKTTSCPILKLSIFQLHSFFSKGEFNIPVSLLFMHF